MTKPKSFIEEANEKMFEILLEGFATSPSRDWFGEIYDQKQGKTEEKREEIHHHIQLIADEIMAFWNKKIREVVGEIEKWLVKEELPTPDCHQSHRDLVAGYNQALLKTRQKLNSILKEGK